MGLKMTATPLSTDEIQTDEYFGKPVYTYSLRTGINDGFLARYRVRYVLMGTKHENRRQREAGVAEQTGKFVSDVSNVSVVSLVADVSNEEEEGREQGTIVGTPSQQQADFPGVEQPPVSVDVSGES